MHLYPPPRQLRRSGGRLNRKGRTYLRLHHIDDPRVARAAQALAEHAELDITYGQPRAGETLLTLISETSGPQAYHLRSTTDGMILRGDPAGLYYGLQACHQLLDEYPDRLPCFDIRDHPDFERRGVMLDISRCKVPKLETLLTLIDRFARLRYNELQLYVEHTFAFVEHRQVWAGASPLTANDILKLRQYCADRFIDLVPNLNSFGHFERWLRHPDYHRFAECPDGFVHPLSGVRFRYGSTLRPDRQSLTLLRSLYAEYLPLFNSALFNIGGDEPWELGAGFSRRRCASIGTTAVYLDFLHQIQRLVHRQGRRMMFWSDIIQKAPECLGTLDQNLIALNWGYEADHPFPRETRRLAEAGVDFYVCPGTSSWNSLTGRLSNAKANLGRAAAAGINQGALGYLVTDWGDGGHHQYLPISYPGFLLGACHAWNHRKARQINIADGVARTFFGATAPARAASQLLLRLGRAPDTLPSAIRNASPFNLMMFEPASSDPDQWAHLRDRQLAAADDNLGDIGHGLRAVSTSLDPGPVTQELTNAVQLARHGIHRLQYRRGIRRDKARLRRELQHCIDQHRALWLARNRRGGLAESARRLTRTGTLLSP